LVNKTSYYWAEQIKSLCFSDSQKLENDCIEPSLPALYFEETTRNQQYSSVVLV
jgi:hypothetical protein